MDICSNKDLIRSHVITIILKSLQTDDKYGYEICKEIEDKTDGAYTLKQPTLYSCLKRLESQKYIMSYWGEVSNGGRRKYYALTEQGQEFLSQDQKEWEYSRTLINRLLSDKEYDLSSPGPFDASELRPYTKKSTELYNQSEDVTTNSILRDEIAVTNTTNAGIDPLANDDNANCITTNDDSLAKDSIAAPDVKIKPITYYSNNTTNQYGHEEEKIQSNTTEDNTNYLDAVEYLVASSMSDCNVQPSDQETTTSTDSPTIDAVPIENANTFNELQAELYSKGYKLRCYSKTNSATYYSMNFIYQNRLSALHLFILALLLSLEAFGVYFHLNSYLGLSLNTYIYIALFSLSLPLIGLVRLLINPNRKKKADFDFKYSLINSLVVAFNLLLTILVLGFLIFRIDFTNFATLVLPVIIPTIIVLDLPLAVVIYQIIYNTKKFRIR